ncbi:sarcosine oxidase, subunit gamma [Janthinobacterium sp. CG_23.3]|uniref:sarcosine oxidase subunit gamma n=1 Tax=Janthinobacterium sp. CG_23.3 TaxID=3349634 RepID=UPI0038D47A60
MFNESAQFAAAGGTVVQPYLQSPLHSFGLAAKARPQDGSHGVWMNELALLGYVALRGDAADPLFRAGVAEALGAPPPLLPSSFVQTALGLLLWQSPDEWLLVCARRLLNDAIAKLESATGGLHAQVVDNSGGLTQVYLSGANHLAVLHHVGVYDFELVTPGRAVSTMCGRANMLVYRVDADGVFVVFRRSFADYVWLLLNKAARPYGIGVQQLPARAAHPVQSLLGGQ